MSASTNAATQTPAGPSDGLLRLQESIKADISRILTQAQSCATNSRKGTFEALALAYTWHYSATAELGQKAAEEYFKDIYGRMKPPIKWKSTSSDFVPLVKLTFTMSDKVYASTVSRYAKALEYLDLQITERIKNLSDTQREMFLGEQRKLVQEFAHDVLNKAGSVEQCIANLEAKDGGNASNSSAEEQILKHIASESAAHYKTSKPIDISLPSKRVYASKDNLVLLLGRESASGKYEIVDCLEASNKDIERYVIRHAFRDTSNVDAVVNLFADTTSLAAAVPTPPVFSVFGGGQKILVSPQRGRLGPIIETHIKGAHLQAIRERLVVADSYVALMQQELVEAPRRRLFKSEVIESQSKMRGRIDGVIAQIVFENTISSEASRFINLTKPSDESRYQIARDDRALNGWDFDETFSINHIELLYGQWLRDWPETRRISRDERTIHVAVTKKGIAFHTENSTDFLLDVGVPSLRNERADYPITGNELVVAIGAIRLISGVEKVSLRGYEDGLLELSCENTIARYTVDLPTMTGEGGTYSNKLVKTTTG